MSVDDCGESEGGWRHNPVVGVVAGLAIAIVLLTVLVRVACRGRAAREPLDTRTVPVICPHDGEVFEVSRKAVGLPADAELDALQLKAPTVPCPKCGKAEGKLAADCIHCNKPYAAPTSPKEVAGFVCPHCGKRPW